MIQDPYLHGSVEVLTARPDPPAVTLFETWCCQGCGNDRPLLAAWRTSVRNRAGPAHVRELRLCAICVRDLIAAGQLDLVAGRTTSGVAGPTLDLNQPAPEPEPVRPAAGLHESLRAATPGSSPVRSTPVGSGS